MNTADFLALPPQERFALIEEHIFGRHVFRNHITNEPTHYSVAKGALHPIPDRDEASGWWEMALRTERKCNAHLRLARNSFGTQAIYEHKELGWTMGHHLDKQDYLAVQVASLRALGVITD